MAVEQAGVSVTLKAGQDLSSAQFTFVKLSADNTVVQCSATTDNPIGVLQNKPGNLGAAEVMTMGRSKLVAGVNLPMLLRSVSYRHETLDALVTRAVAGGTQGVMQVAITAPQNQARRKNDQDKYDHQQ